MLMTWGCCCYADFDIKTLKISNVVTIAAEDRGCVREYPCWNRDGSIIVYDSSRYGIYKVYAYRLADKVTECISPSEGLNNSFANFKGLPR